MNKKNVPLRRRLVLLAVAGILPLALMAGIGIAAMYAQQRAQAERTALEVTRALSTAIDAELQKNVAVLEVLASSSSLHGGDHRLFEERLRREAPAHPAWHTAMLLDPDGNVLLNARPDTTRKSRRALEPGSLQETLRDAGPTVGSLARGPGGSWGFAVRVPVMRNGTVRYVLTAVLRPESIGDVILRQRLEQGWVVTVVDRQGLRVVRWPGQEQFVGTPGSGTLQEMMHRGTSEATGITRTSEGNEVYTAYSRSPRTGWSVALGIPTGQVAAAAYHSLAAFAGGLLLSLALAAIATVAIARSVNRPIAELRSAAQAVGRGEAPSEVVTDIRELHEVSRALAVSSAQRARAEAEREQLLEREQAARALAESANRAKDEFLAMLGHELRNPLAAIANASFMLQRPEASASVKSESSAIIARQVAHLSRMTDDLLDAGRALLGKIELQREPVDVAHAVANTLATLEAAGRTARHRVIVRLHEAWAQADPIRLDQIVANLVVNATKYTPAGGRIEVRVEREGEWTVIRVADDGIGLPPELARRAFDLFVQGDRDLDRSQGGLGIGLTLVRRLSELHGGSVDVHSGGTGKGSEFVVRLPAVEPLSQAPQPKPARQAASRRILVIEDNRDARETLCTLLELAGHRVDSAADGRAGLEMALAIQPEVALVDIGLPGLDGYEVARRLRSAQGRRVHLVALTGYGAPEDRRRALEAGFDEHLVKPVDHATLHELLARTASAALDA